jgi:hypothetical protein
MELKMSASSPATTFSPAPIGDTSATKNATRSRSIRQGSFVLGVAAALAVAACAGGAGLRLDAVHSESGNYCVDEAQNLLQKKFGPNARITKAQQIDSYGTWKLRVMTNLCSDHFIFMPSSLGMNSCTMPAYGSAPTWSLTMLGHGDCADLPAQVDRANLPAEGDRQ